MIIIFCSYGFKLSVLHPRSFPSLGNRWLVGPIED